MNYEYEFSFDTNVNGKNITVLSKGVLTNTSIQAVSYIYYESNSTYE